MAELIGAAETSRILRRSRSWVTRSVQAGELKPKGRLGGDSGAYLFDRRDVERLSTKLAKGDNERLAKHPEFQAAVDEAVAKALAEREPVAS
jgi:hypothetical protein